MKRLYSILSNVLGIPENEIQDRLTPNDVPGWDSFNALILVSELESAFKVKFTYPEVTGVKCIGDIKTMLRKHQVELTDAP